MKTQITIQCVGYVIAADLYIADGAKNFLLVVVGLNSSKERNAPFVQTILEATHQNALVLDLSGHGESPFSLADISPAQHLNEVVHAFDWLHGTYLSAEITVMGTSYGGYLAAYLSQYRTFSKLLLRTPALYRPQDFFTNHGAIDILHTATVYRNDVDVIATHPMFTSTKEFTGLSFVVVHGDDEVVPTPTTDQYIATFNPEVYIADGFKHSFNDPTNPQENIQVYIDTLARWIM
jgi:uncharacterized protein